jgi:NitT/TauT family transport system substrate-binding protein
VLALLLAAGCGGSGGASPKAAVPNRAQAPSKAPTPVRFETAWIPVANQLPWYYALEHGEFARAGLDVTITSGKGSVTTAQQVGAGQFDIGQTDLTVMALARGKGEPLKAIFVEFPKSPFGVFVAKSTGVTDFKGLAGRSVIVSAGSVESFLLPPTLKKVGLKVSAVHQVIVQPSAKDGDYVNDEADALANEIPANAPFVDPKRPSNHLYFGSVLPVPYLGLFARDDYLHTHPSAVRSFVQVSQAALQKLIADPQAVADVADYVAEHNKGVSASVLIASWKDYAGFFSVPAQRGHPIGWMPPAMWRQTVGILQQYAGLTPGVSPDAFYTNQFVGG